MLTIEADQVLDRDDLVRRFVSMFLLLLLWSSNLGLAVVAKEALYSTNKERIFCSLHLAPNITQRVISSR